MKLAFMLLMMIFMLAPARADFYDPMKPPAYALTKMKLEALKKNPLPVKTLSRTAERSEWVLSSILYSSTRQHAIINDKLVKKGDVLAGARLVNISKDRVQLKKKGKLIELKLEANADIRVKSKIKTMREKTL